MSDHKTLIELNAMFVRDTNYDGPGAQGVMFNCPNPKCHHSQLVWFANPETAPVVATDRLPLPRWTRLNSTLADLTLAPSIRTDCAHFYVEGGKIRNV